MDRYLDDEPDTMADDELDDELGEDESGSDAGTPLARRIDADSILDSLVPNTIDWRDTVRRHPVGSVMCVGLVGYLVGRTKGAAIMSGITAGLSAALMRQLADVFEGDFFEY